jgi:hypothetical protein
MSCWQLLEVYRLWLIYFRADICNCTRVQRYSRWFGLGTDIFQRLLRYRAGGHYNGIWTYYNIHEPSVASC